MLHNIESVISETQSGFMAGKGTRCHELSLPINRVCTGQSSDSERARYQ